MIYLDSSCLLKLLLSEPESEVVGRAVAHEGDVVVSALTELETAIGLSIPQSVIAKADQVIE